MPATVDVTLRSVPFSEGLVTSARQGCASIDASLGLEPAGWSVLIRGGEPDCADQVVAELGRLSGGEDVRIAHQSTTPEAALSGVLQRMEQRIRVATAG